MTLSQMTLASLTSKWSKLEHLDLHKCQLNMCDIEALAAATVCATES